MTDQSRRSGAPGSSYRTSSRRRWRLTVLCIRPSSTRIKPPAARTLTIAKRYGLHGLPAKRNVLDAWPSRSRLGPILEMASCSTLFVRSSRALAYANSCSRPGVDRSSRRTPGETHTGALRMGSAKIGLDNYSSWFVSSCAASLRTRDSGLGRLPEPGQAPPWPCLHADDTDHRRHVTGTP